MKDKGSITNTPNWRANNIDFADKEEGGEERKPKLCGRSQKELSAVTHRTHMSSDAGFASRADEEEEERVEGL